MNNYEIVDMNMAHVDEVTEIEASSFRTPWSKEAFVNELQRNKCAKYRVLTHVGKVIAYGGMWIIVDEAHITNIAVHPQYRGKGIGQIIVEDMINQGRNLNVASMTLEVRTSNIAAIRLYSKFGFKEEAIRKGYYADTGEDAIIMWRRILIE